MGRNGAVINSYAFFYTIAAAAAASFFVRFVGLCSLWNGIELNPIDAL